MILAAGIKVFTLGMLSRRRLGAGAASMLLFLRVDFYLMTFPSNEIALAAPRSSQRVVCQTQGTFLH
jgi:hypothetical protein